MPLHINLYHEVQRQELARQRDPLRLGMLAVLVIAIGFVANYFVVLERAHVAGIHFADIQGAWSGLQPKAQDAKARQDQLNSEIQASDALKKTIDSRFDWAPVLQEILKSAPRSVQLTHVSVDVPDDDKAISGVLSLSGISGAVEPRKQAEAVRTALEASLARRFTHVSSVFKQLDDSDQFAMLDGRRLATAAFTIEFQIQLRAPVVVATPPPRKAKAAAAASE